MFGVHVRKKSFNIQDLNNPKDRIASGASVDNFVSAVGIKL